MLNLIISIIYFLLVGLVMLKGFSENGRTSSIYQRSNVRFFLKMAVLLFLGFSGFFLFYNWKLMLTVLVSGILLSKVLTVPLWDKLILWIIGRK
ncbi:hypothetical protein [Desulforamulus aquiferis]|uniref:Uncharacterized protein n=1 Tax=Desulforamulus aquiferis TaxID=1397668 RepID=A0AAW7ZHM0_9FIRM|nr:hypothetical protein [Desulforamulus aquiferis]MDO7788758.1 hypothetical protein [Desulforamulus aquiferis]RYD05362.1 hypothetical protein N752_09705 [Desulforamulus aquiferis]